MLRFKNRSSTGGKSKGRSRRSGNAAKGPAEKELNLTAMMDVLTILVVFLLKSYTTTPAANLREGLQPPQSSSPVAMTDAVTVSVTRDDITVNDTRVVGLVNGRLREEDRSPSGEGLLIKPLKDALQHEVDYLMEIDARGGSRFDGTLLVVGDRTIDYELISMILYSAGQAHLANFRFVTISS